MRASLIPPEDRYRYEQLSGHPLQSWEWGEFRKKTGVQVIRLGVYGNNRSLTEAVQLTIHPIPHTHLSIGYLPKSHIPSVAMLEALFEFGKKNNCIFIKLEPDIIKSSQNPVFKTCPFPIVSSSHPLFTKYSFLLDITIPEDALQKNFHPKTRYNIKIAKKHGVTVEEDNTAVGFEEYYRLTADTARRQHFFAHDYTYHKNMWDSLSTAGIAHLLKASAEKEGKKHTLVTWIVFIYKNTLYYPYGASSNLYRNTMASNLMMWEAILFGKRNGASKFDMWGALGPHPDPNNPWYGFHRFKQGYGPSLVEYIGSFDLVISPAKYSLYNLAHLGRKSLLDLKAYLKTLGK